MFERLFHLREHDTTVGREVIGGVITFMALCYIVVVQPVVLGNAGMDHGGVFVATCVCSAFACILMGLWSNLPIALAPAMGHNFFFAFTVCGAVAAGGLGWSWQEALAANLIAGAVFILLASTGLQEALIRGIPDSLKYAIAVGIGLLIAFVGRDTGKPQKSGRSLESVRPAGDRGNADVSYPRRPALWRSAYHGGGAGGVALRG